MLQSLSFAGVVIASVFDYVSGHTEKICVGVEDQTVTFYGGVWDAHPFISTTTGGVILSNGATGNGRYNFTSTLVDDNEFPLGVDLTNFACTSCQSSGGTRTINYWQKVVIDGLTCDSVYDVITTSDSVIEQPACSPFPQITIPPCGCDETMDIKCRATGDPHFTTWDGTRHHFQGVGYYDYVAACDDYVFFPFTITAKQEECGRWAPMTCITEVRVTLSDGRVIIFPRNGRDPTWMSDGSSAVGDDQTFTDGTFSVQQKTFSGTFEDDGTDITIMFTYYKAYFQAMTSSDCMEDRICGVCGNVNGDSSDDFEKRDGTIVDNTDSGRWRVPDDVWDNTFCFGDSWCNEDFTNDPDCEPTPVPTQPPTDCIHAGNEYCAEAYDKYCDNDCSSDDLDYDAWIQDCIFDACAASNNNLADYQFGDALNNGFFDSSLDECRHFCEITGKFYADCGPCNDQCMYLTGAYGCDGNECLDTCANCVSDIDWDDYAGGQSNDCQCHDNGCDLCQDGWFKVDYDFPCQSCSGLPGCLHCTDFLGCQQCEDGYTMVESSTCGEDSNLNTGYAKFHYCVPNDSPNGKCVVGDPGFDEVVTPAPTAPSCPVDSCDSNPCDCSSDYYCNDCQSWGCNSCAYGYYKQSFGHPCVSCYDTFDGKCNTCTDWQGCTECAYGYTVTWDADCGTNICV